jgi:two-component system cell cycle response regulator CtrA
MEAFGDTHMNTLSTCCECCGRPIPLENNGVRLDERIVSFKDQTAKLTNKEAAVFSLLLRYFGQVVHRDRVWANVWGDGCEVDPKIVDVMLCKIRKKIAHMGLTTRNTWGVGQALTFADPVVSNVSQTIQTATQEPAYAL